MSLRPENPRAAKAATVRRKLKRAGWASRSRSGMRQMQPSVAALDALWSRIIKARDDDKCRRCGKTSNLQAAHIRSRRYASTRWMLDNGLTLCAGDHLWAHHEPLKFVAWINEILDVAVMRRLLIAQVTAAGYRTDRALVLLELEAEARKLGL